MKTSEHINELANALGNLQAELQPAQMNATNPFLKNKYADLNSIVNASQHLLSKYGLAYVQMPTTPPNGELAIALTTRLMHTSGQWIEDTFVMPIPTEEKGKSIMQVAGSAITYARRYALSAMLGIVADEDSDGNYPTGKPLKNVPNKPEPTTVSDDQRKPSEAMIKKLHAAGKEVYGDEWDERRAMLIKSVTGGRSDQTAHLTFDECKKLIDGIEAKRQS